MPKSEIHFEIDVDDERIPEKIRWSATDAPGESDDTKAISIAVWDAEEESTMRIDLWTKDMAIDEMKGFYINALAGMAESLEAATGDTAMAKEMIACCERLAEIASGGDDDDDDSHEGHGH